MSPYRSFFVPCHDKESAGDKEQALCRQLSLSPSLFIGRRQGGAKSLKKGPPVIRSIRDKENQV
jgi:hypothetical protein